MCLRTYGRDIGIRVNEPAVLSAVATRLPVPWRPAEPPVVDRLYSLRVAPPPAGAVRYYNVLYADSVRIARSTRLEDCLEALDGDLRRYVAATARPRLFVHAGVVACGDRAIVIPGASHSGKTTLVKAFVEAGATYYSDEYAVLDHRGRVHPYPKPLSLRTNGDGPPAQHPVEALGGVAGTRPLAVACVLVTRYRAGARRRPRRLSPGQATLALLANTVPVRRRPRSSLAILQRVRPELCLLGARGEPEAVVRSVLARLTAPRRGSRRVASRPRPIGTRSR